MTGFSQRWQYALRAARRSRPITVNPLAANLFFLMPERLASLTRATCRFRCGDFIFRARRPDWSAVEQVILDGEYDFVSALLAGKSRPTIVDLGANIGTFALLAFTHCPDAVVHSVEPSRGTYEVLLRNRLANPQLNWHVYQAAVWQTDGQVRLKHSGPVSTQSFVAEDGEELVPALSLESLLRRHVRTPVDLLKVDIEGAEEAVICGQEELLDCVGDLIIQIHPGRCNEARVIAALRKKFDALYRVPGRQSPQPLLLASRRKFQLPCCD